jgi:hypothetical protein
MQAKFDGPKVIILYRVIKYVCAPDDDQKVSVHLTITVQKTRENTVF